MYKKIIISILGSIGLLGLVSAVLIYKQYRNIPNAIITADPIAGSDNALVKIIEYSDFACSSCRKMYHFLKQAQIEFGDQITVQFKDYPLTPIHPNAMVAAEAGQCALQQTAFWIYHDRLFNEQDQWVPQRDPHTIFIQYAQELGLDASQFSYCLSKHSTQNNVIADMAAGQALNIYQTPTLYINDEEYTGVSTYDSLAKKIRDKLSQ